MSPGGRRLRVEADGGSRGNPGVAGSGALVRDEATGVVLRERARPLGQASNNVAEYTALVLGLEAAEAVDPTARVVACMDSKLVVEQMSGRWKIKHEDMRRLARQATEVADRIRAAGGRVSYRWVPRAENRAADALSNKAMDGVDVDRVPSIDPAQEEPVPDATEPEASPRGTGDDRGESGDPSVPLSGPTAEADDPAANLPGPEEDFSRRRPRPEADLGPPARVVLVRHGVTDNTVTGRLDGRGGKGPSLNAEGVRQAHAAARGVVSFVGRHGVRVVSSSLARAHETGLAVAAALGLPCEVDDGWDEIGFGDWDGRRVADIIADDPDALARAWADDEVARPGGESRAQLRERVAGALDRCAESGGTAVVVTHRGPILASLSHLLGTTHRQLSPLATAPASLTSLRIWADGGVQVEFVNDTSHLR